MTWSSLSGLEGDALWTLRSSWRGKGGALDHGAYDRFQRCHHPCHVATWRGRRVQGGVDDWPWVDCEYVLVDYGVALAAAPNLHTAGLGDILCGYAGPVESQWRADNGYGPPLDTGVFEEFERYHQGLVEGFARPSTSKAT